MWECGVRSSPLGWLGQEPSLKVVHKENFLSKIKVAVAGPLPDEKALWRGDTQAIQGDVGDFGLEHKGRPCLQGPAWGHSVCSVPPLSCCWSCCLCLRAPPEKELPPRPVHSPVASLLYLAVLGAGQAGDKAGEALPWWTRHRGLKWYDMVVKGMDSGALTSFPASMSLFVKWAQ